MPGAPFGNLREVVLADLLLRRLVHAERTMVGRDDLEVVLGRCRFHSTSWCHFSRSGRRHHELRAFEAFALVVVVGEKQVLRAGFGVRGQAHVARLA